MPTHRRRRWQGRCFGHQQGLRHCIGSLNIPSSCTQQPHFPPPPMWDDYESPCASEGGPCKRDRSTSCRVDRSTSYRRPSFRYERHPKCKRRPSHPYSRHRYRTCLPTEPLYCDEYGLPCSSRRDCQEYITPCYPNQEPPSPCYPQETPCYVPKATSPCYSPLQPCNVPQPCYPQPPQQQPCFPPEPMPLPQCYMQPPAQQCYTQDPPCFSEDEMYPCPPMSEHVQTMVSLPPCFFRKIGPCQDHEPLCRFLSPTCSKPVSVCIQPSVPCAAPQPCPAQPTPCPADQPVCPNFSASVQCLPPRQDSGTVCERRNVSFGCLQNASPPACMLPPCEYFSRKCQADLPDEDFSDSPDGVHQHRRSKCEMHQHKKSVEKVICECSTSVSSLKKKHKKDKRKKSDLDVCECNSCRCEEVKERQLCTCMCSDSNKMECECSKTSSKNSRKAGKKSSVANQITCECYDVALDPIRSNFVVEKAVGMSRDCLAKKKSSHRGDSCHCKNSASKNSVGGCSCHYPPAFEQLSCAGNIAGSCCCKDT